MPNPSLSIVNNLEGVDISGNTFLAKQGGIADDFGEGVDITITGYKHEVSGTVATASARTIFDDDDDFPTAPLYIHLWVNGTWTTEVVWVQVIGTSTHFILPLYPEIPFVLRSNTILGAASTTALDGSAAPSTQAIDSIIIANRSGAGLTYKLTMVF